MIGGEIIDPFGTKGRGDRLARIRGIVSGDGRLVLRVAAQSESRGSDESWAAYSLILNLALQATFERPPDEGHCEERFRTAGSAPRCRRWCPVYAEYFRSTSPIRCSE